MSSLYRLVGSLLLALSLIVPPAVRAEEAADPPGRIGRLAVIEGDVSFRPQRDAAGEAAMLNWPLSSGAVLETGSGGRAEAWVDAIAVRLDAASRVEFATIDDRQVLLDLNAGRLGLSLMDGEQAGDLLLRLPDGRVRFAAAGRYRVAVAADRSELTVFAGRASIEHDGGQTQLSAGERATLLADGSLHLGAAERPDAFDHWVAERENATIASTARGHVSSAMTGYPDLDTYGDWSNHADYGAVWMPRTVAADWAPYRFGRWAWVAPWGWTWIDAAPWGFAPFHYGRWVVLGSRWAWVPGQRIGRPVYAPALVAWLGNPGWSVRFGFGTVPAVGWFPLGPREVYVPRYRHSPGYIRRLNIVHVHDVTVIERAARGGPPPHFAHRDSPRAVTVVPAERLRQGRSIGSADVSRIDRRELERAPAGGRRDWLTPTPEARRPGGEIRPGQPGPARVAGPDPRPGADGRPPRRDETRPAGATFADRPAAAPASRQPWSGTRPAAAGAPRNASVPSSRPPAMPGPARAPGQAAREIQRPRDERGSRLPVPGAATPFKAPTGADRRRDGWPRPAVGPREAPRLQPVPQLRSEPRAVTRPLPRQDAGQHFRRAEPAAPRPIMRAPASAGGDSQGRGGASRGGRGPR